MQSTNCKSCGQNQTAKQDPATLRSWIFGLPAFTIPTPTVVIRTRGLLNYIAIFPESEDFLTAIAAQSFGQNNLLQIPATAGTRIDFTKVYFLLFVDRHGGEQKELCGNHKTLRKKIQLAASCISLKLKTRPEGLEPSTFGFGDQRSTNWTKDAGDRDCHQPLSATTIETYLSRSKRCLTRVALPTRSRR